MQRQNTTKSPNSQIGKTIQYYQYILKQWFTHRPDVAVGGGRGFIGVNDEDKFTGNSSPLMFRVTSIVTLYSTSLVSSEHLIITSIPESIATQDPLAGDQVIKGGSVITG